LPIGFGLPMPIKMISRLGRAMPRFLSGANIAGEGLQERLRSAAFALLGLATAVGLVLVGIAYNQGWPDFVDSPIPGTLVEGVGDARVAAEPARAKGSLAIGGLADASLASSPRSQPSGRSGDAPDASSGTGLSAQQQLAVAPSAGEGTSPAPPEPGGAPPGGEAPAGGGAPAATEPEAAALPIPADPQAAQGAVPITASTKAPQVAAVPSTPAKGKAKGHEKSNGRPAPASAAAAATPSPPPLAQTPAPEVTAPAAEGPGNGNGKGHAYGHSK